MRPILPVQRTAHCRLGGSSTEGRIRRFHRRWTGMVGWPGHATAYRWRVTSAAIRTITFQGGMSTPTGGRQAEGLAAIPRAIRTPGPSLGGGRRLYVRPANPVIGLRQWFPQPAPTVRTPARRRLPSCHHVDRASIGVESGGGPKLVDVVVVIAVVHCVRVEGWLGAAYTTSGAVATGGRRWRKGGQHFKTIV